MTNETLTLIGAIGGSAIGVLGGVVGTWFSIRNTQGPREKAFMIQAAALCWIAVTILLASLLIIPYPYQFLLLLPYFLALPFAIHAMNRRQEQIRKAEAGVSDGRGGL